MTEIGKQNTGFSIVEAMVSVFILMTTLAVGLSLFSFTSKNTRKVEVAQNQRDAIEADIASILRANDRYQCTASSDGSCSLASTDPDENSYLPASTESSKNWISTKCATGFGPALVGAIGNLSQPANKEIQRIATADAANKHLYKVEWRVGTQIIRSLTLYPSVAAWCPMRKQRRLRSAGFTLAEVLIVIVIVGILSIIALDMSTKAKQREQVNALAINLAGWLNQVRKSSLRGSGCSIQIISPISAESTIAKSAITSSTATALNAVNACLANQPLTMMDINPSASQVNYTITQTPSNPIVFTPRGSVTLPSGFSSINLEIKLMPSGPSRCVSIQGLIANINISKGDSCGNQERF